MRWIMANGELRRVGFPLALAMVLGPAMPAAALCDARLSGVRGGAIYRGQGYDGFAMRESVETFALDVTNTGDDACVFVLTFTSRAGGRRTLVGPTATLGYDLLRSTSRVDIIPNSKSATDASLPRVILAPGQTLPVDYFALIPEGQIVPSGSYYDEVMIDLLEETSRFLLDQRTLSLSTEVVPHAEINLSGGSAGTGGRQGFIDFGRLSQGDERTVRLEIRSNDEHFLALASEHGGQLQHTESETWSIDYDAILDGSTLGLESPNVADRLLRPGSTSIRGDSLELTIRIGEVDRKLAGNYQDTITIRMDPL